MQVDSGKQRAVFLDRDGTLMEEVNYCSCPEDVRIITGVGPALLRLKQAGFLNIIITNQAGIGRGYFTLADYENVQAELLHQLGEGTIDATYFCPDHPEQASNRRKPGTGMIKEATRDFAIDLPGSFFIGDKAIDVECGHRAGLRTVLVATGYGARERCEPDFRAPDLTGAVDWILSL